MQIKALPHNLYRFYNYAIHHEIKEAHEYLEKYGKKYIELVEKWETLKGFARAVKEKVVGISQATYYRYKKKIHDLSIGIPLLSQRPKNLRKSKVSYETKEMILKIRTDNPTYGKDKITTILKREYEIQITTGTVGRVIKELKEQGKITKSRSALRSKRKRKFEGHAQRWKYGMKAKTPGEMIQIDHMTTTICGRTYKHFQACDPVTKFMYANIYSNATSQTAAKFLKEMLSAFPYIVLSIQVDGGSEFMMHFEETVKNLGIPMFVLPPRRPQWNGNVERGNRTLREEFYADSNIRIDSIEVIRDELKKFLHKYNTYRPHKNLNNLTPMVYTKSILKSVL